MAGHLRGAGEASLATRPTDGADLESERLKAKLGEMLLERELLDAKIAALEANRPLARRRSRPCAGPLASSGRGRCRMPRWQNAIRAVLTAVRDSQLSSAALAA